MFAIPATELGTNLTVYVDTATTPNSRFGSMGTIPPTYVQIPYPINTVAELKAFIAATSIKQLDTIYLPHSEYTAVAADWFSRGTPSASAFKVGDWVTWSPPINTMSQYGALVIGQMYCIIACAWSGPPACWTLSLSDGGSMVDVADEDELTIVSQPSTQLSRFRAPAVPPIKRCECGATKCKSSIHSEWCPMVTPRH